MVVVRRVPHSLRSNAMRNDTHFFGRYPKAGADGLPGVLRCCDNCCRVGQTVRQDKSKKIALHSLVSGICIERDQVVYSDNLLRAYQTRFELTCMENYPAVAGRS